ncbi:uncharacterized protein C12orf76 homolog [Hipposideros larvatus]
MQRRSAVREWRKWGFRRKWALCPYEPRKMLRAVWWWLCFDLCSFLVGQAEAQSPVEPSERSRPYAVLRGQNLVLMGTIFSILLVTMILMAFCVYKPIRRR